MALVSKVTGRYERTVTQARARSELVDHAFRTKERYSEAFGGRLAAAIAYYGFFAVFAFGVVGYSILGFLLEYHINLRNTVDEFLQENLPVIEVSQISAGRGAAGGFGLVGLLLTGVAWVEALRSSVRRLWGLEQQPGNVFKRRAIDVLALLLLALLLGGSFALAFGLEQLLGDLPVATPLRWLLTIGVNLVVALALLAALPRLRISPRRILPPALLAAVAMLVLNSAGRLYIERVQDNAAYAVVATAAGLLVYLYLFHQIVLWAAAWSAASQHGRVLDLAGGSPPASDDNSG